jgi:ATP-dependent DNA ligase
VREHDGESTMRLPYLERRELLELLDIGGLCTVGEPFDDGAALERAVLEHRLAGVVAKRPEEPCRPGERSWLKKKNPGLAAYEAEREAIARERDRRRLPLRSV